MPTLLLVNRVDELVPRMTTSLLLEAALRRGLDARVCALTGLWLAADGRPMAAAIRPPTPPAARDDEPARARWLAALGATPAEPLAIGPADRLWIRTNPARDTGRAAQHRLALDLAALAAERGTAVANAPAGLSRAASKLYLARLPAATRPRTLVASEAAALRGFVAEAPGPAVLKPLSGTRGAGVFRVTPEEPNLGAILESLLAAGPVMAQDWVPGAEAGDTRVLLLDGRPLELGGQLAAIRRVPAAGDFRSNLHAGGRAEPAALDAAARATLAAIGPGLVADGLRLVGVDLIGDQVIELNVFSTGGLRDAERFSGQDFSDRVVRALSQAPPAAAPPSSTPALSPSSATRPPEGQQP